MSNYSVYMIVSPEGKRYIGMTMRKVEYRWNHGRGYKKNEPFMNDIEKFGWDKFKKVVLAKDLSEKEASKKEQFYIRFFKTQDPQKGYNREMGGKTYEMAEQTKEKIRVSHLGQFRDEEYRKHISESKKGAKNGMFGKYDGQNPNATKVIATNGEEELSFDSISEASRQLRLSKNAFKNISACCKGKRKTAYGYVWRYADDS